MQTLTRLRISTTKRLAGLEIPSAFQSATVSAAVNALDRKDAKQARRLADKVRAIQERSARETFRALIAKGHTPESALMWSIGVAS